MNHRLEVVYNILRLLIVNKTYPTKSEPEKIIIKRTEEVKRPMGQKKYSNNING